jgi:MFS family permease
MSSEAATPSRLSSIPRSIWALGLVSLFMDLSSEMIHALLPIYLVTVLGASALTVGLIEGVAEATANITKIFSGALSDWLGRRKLLAALGYGLAACTRPIFPLATTLGWVLAARLIDRLGKGIRGAPRDALIADLSPAALRGASFGLRQSLDTVGAFLGPLVAIALLALGADIRLVFWIAIVPALISFALIVFAVEEPARHVEEPATQRLRLADARRLSTAYWTVVVIASVLTLARFSEAFLVLRAQDVGFSVTLVPIVMVVMSAVYAVSAYPAGVLSDRFGRASVLSLGIALLIAADLVLALAATAPLVLAGVALWGLHMGLTQGLLATLVADTAPADLRGTAFGLFHLAGGLAMLVASVIAGALWDAHGPAATFLAGAAFTALALIGFAAWRSFEARRTKSASSASG